MPVSNSVRVPGSRAGKYSGKRLGDGLLRHLLQARCGLGLFARSLFGRFSSDQSYTEAGSQSHTLPMPLPYPEACCAEVRGGGEDGEARARKKLVNCIVICLNYLHLGRSTTWPADCRLGRKLNKLQWAAVKRFEGFLDDWVSSDVFGPEEMGRVAPKVESMEDVLKQLESIARELRTSTSCSYFPDTRDAKQGPLSLRGRGEVVGKLDSCPFSTFKPVEADRLKFVGVPSFNPVPFLDKQSADVYQNPLQLSLDPDSFSGSIPFVQVHCSRDEKMKLFSLLDSCNRLGLHRESDIRKDFASGLFSVVKSLTLDRLILDSRPANLLEQGEQRWIGSLASAESLCRYVIPSGFNVATSGNDLRDFYYLFAVNEERSRRNVLAGAVRAEEVRHLNCYNENLDNGEPLYGTLKTLAMGDTNAVSLAQTCHVGMCLQSGKMNVDQLLTLSGPLPRSKVKVGVIIDDFVTLSEVQAGATEVSAGATLADDLDHIYREVGLIPHTEKGFRDLLKSSFWGSDFNGEDGKIRGSLKRGIPLAWLILRIIKVGHCTTELLQTISGSLVSLFLFRRRMLVLLDSIFIAVRDREPSSIIKLSGRLISELLLCVVLLPLAATNLRAPVSSTLTATDASDWGEAAVTSMVPSTLSHELYRHTLRKSVWTRLLAPAQAWLRSHGKLGVEEELPGEEDMFTANPLWVILARCLQFRLLFKKGATGRRHINIGELRGFLKAEQILGTREPSTRHIFCLDSQVALGAICKGRSASEALNQELCRHLGLLLFNDSYSECIYFPSAENPADDPTRGQDLRGPSMDVPEFLLEAMQGRFGLLDEWLASHNISDYDMSGLPPVSEVLHGDPSTYFSSSKSSSSTMGLDGSHNTADSGFEDVGDLFIQTCEGSTDFQHDHDPLAATVCSGTSAGDAGGAGRLWQFKGVHGWLGRKAAQEVTEILQCFRKDQIFLGTEKQWPPSEAGFLDLFSGECGAAQELNKLTGRWVVTFDILHDPSEDLLSGFLQRRIERLISLGAILGWGAAPVCCSFSVAVTPPIRTALRPYGIAEVSHKTKKKILQGNKSAKWLLRLMQISLDSSIQFWLENPDLSWLFRLPCWKKFVLKHCHKLGFWRTDFCRFGKKWRKRTRILTTTILRNQKTLCLGGHVHQTLRGRSAWHRKSWTLVAQPYPRGLCRALATGLAISSSLVERESFDPAECAKCSGCRIGEAMNPGPAARERNLLLENVPLVEARTLAMQSRYWKWFEDWACGGLSREAFAALCHKPYLLCVLLKEFGNYLFSQGKSLHVYRHLIVYVQKTMLEAKPFMSLNWDMIARWEMLEPPLHRVPIPSSVLRAMVAAAVLLRWHRFGAALCLSFYGITRPGEVLKAVRKDLVLPEDLLLEDQTVAYLRVGEPKPRRRGKGRVQHASVHNELVVRFAAAVFGHIPLAELLYPISHGSFRRRWDAILKLLVISASVKLTPGSLRGGGAVAAYHAGIDLSKLCWRMRLKSLTTLESYVQEVAAATLLSELPSESRKRIKQFSDMFEPCLLATIAPRAPV